jgi:hypothetical protein
VAYIASQIAIWIVVSVLFGFAIGWLARGRTKGIRSPKKRTMKFR